jgi:DNA-binding CsgD family transcriptional regulator
VEALANNLGLNSIEIKQELISGKSLKQILLENGITPDELQVAFSGN